MKVLIQVILLVAVFVTLALAHGHHSQNFHKENKHDICRYTNTKGVNYNLHLLSQFSNQYDLSFVDTASGSTFYFSPCGQNTSRWGIPVGTAAYQQLASNKIVLWGTSSSAQVSDAGFGQNSSMEVIYGNGEVCNNGVPRKAIITYVCDITHTTTYPTITGEVDSCSVSVTVKTPFACPVANYCATIHNDESCNYYENICVWSFGRCRASGCFYSSFASGGVLALVLITVTGLLLLCTCGLCICACKKRRNCKKRAASKAINRRSSKKSTKKTSKKAGQPRNDSTEYAPFQMPFQLIPGGNAPVNPYSSVQGYPMVTLVAPGTAEQDV